MQYYVIATQQPWGHKVFDAVVRSSEHWWLDSREVLALIECVNFHFKMRQ